MDEFVTQLILAGDNATETLEQGTKARLIESAAELLDSSWQMKLPTMREIAAGAGVSPGAAYRHFSSQEELFMAVVRWRFHQLETALRQAVGDASDPREVLERFAHGYAAWGLTHPGSYQILFETTDDLRIASGRGRPGIHLLTELAGLIEVIAPSPQSSEVRSQRLWSSLHGIVSLRIHKIGMEWATTLDSDIAALVERVVTP